MGRKTLALYKNHVLIFDSTPGHTWGCVDLDPFVERYGRFYSDVRDQLCISVDRWLAADKNRARAKPEDLDKTFLRAFEKAKERNPFLAFEETARCHACGSEIIRDREPRCPTCTWNYCGKCGACKGTKRVCSGSRFDVTRLLEK